MKGYAIVNKKGKILEGPRDREECLCIFKHKGSAQFDIISDADEQIKEVEIIIRGGKK